MKTSLLGMVGIVSVTLTLSACSTASPILSEWRNPAYALGPFKRIMVGGLSRETSVRRNFEDEFVIQLRAAGIDALASYRYSPEDEGIDENNLKSHMLIADQRIKIPVNRNDSEIKIVKEEISTSAAVKKLELVKENKMPDKPLFLRK